MNERELLESALTALDLEPSVEQIELFLAYRRILLDWNSKINLTAITDPQEILLKHFVDSAFIAEYAGGNMLDVGTGAGFPGVPVKIIRPETSLTLLDSLNKRITFLRVLIAELGLDEVDCIHSRAEDAARTPLREGYELVVSRAVAGLPSLMEYCLPFAKVGGKFISMKGPDAKDEISLAKKAITTLGGEISEIKRTKIPFTDIEHSLIIVSKIRHTSDKYPRKSVKIAKNPII